MVPVPVSDVPEVLRLVQTARITVLPGAPTIHRKILDHPDRKAFDLRSLRVAVTAAAIDERGLLHTGDLATMDDFPRTASGKIRKVDLRAWLRSPQPGQEEAP